MADHGGDYRRGGVDGAGDASARPGLHDRRVYIGGIPYSIDGNDKLAELLHQRGIRDHESLKVPLNPEDGRPRGFAFASFASAAAATRCIEALDQTTVEGRLLSCKRSFVQDESSYVTPGSAGYMPPAMEVRGVNKGESQWDVLARIQARYGVAIPAVGGAGPTGRGDTAEAFAIPPPPTAPPPPPDALNAPTIPPSSIVLPKISSLAAVVGRDAARRATAVVPGPIDDDDGDDGERPPPPPPGGPPIPSGSTTTADAPPVPGLGSQGLGRGPKVLGTPKVFANDEPPRGETRKAGDAASERRLRRERMRKLRASGVFVMGDGDGDDGDDEDGKDGKDGDEKSAPGDGDVVGRAEPAKRARVVAEEVRGVTGLDGAAFAPGTEASSSIVVDVKRAELAPSKVEEIRARAAAAAAKAAARAVGMS